MFAQTLKMDAATLLSAFSPSKTCKVRVSSTRYRNDPYRARVMPFAKPFTPVFTGKKFYAAPAAIVPIAAPAVIATAAPSPVKQVPVAVPAAKPAAAAVKPTAAAVVAAPAPKPAAPIAALKDKQDPAARAQEHFAVIGFKHETGTYRAPFRVAPGDVVVVEADRGEHIGVVQSVSTVKPKFNVPSCIVRRAHGADMANAEDLVGKEKRVTASVQKLAESFGLGIRVIDVEFQADGNKLTVFFASKCFVDFRKLQRSLFRDYRCRIWLVNWAEVRPYTPVPVNYAQAA